jgi:phenylalanyl-tRNA synthetase beta chain
MAKGILRELAFTEVYNYSFLSEKMKDIFEFKEKDLIEIENPISFESRFLRPTLICNLLKNVQENFRYFEEIKIFEQGKTYKKSRVKTTHPIVLPVKSRTQPQKSKVWEKEMLTGLIAKKGKVRTEDFYQLKGEIDLLLSKFGLSNIWYADYQPTPEESKIEIWHPQKCAEIKANQQKLGFLGEISPRTLRGLEIEGGVILFDLDFEKLENLAISEQEYRPFSRCPSAIRDIAILVPQKTKAIDVLSIINRAGGKLVREVDLFDIYEGEELPESRKNFAFHIIYQAEDYTLSLEEIDKIHNKIVEALEREGWQVRK